MKIQEINAKSVLTKSGLPGSHYVINPYIGCTFGCSYCYADFMRRFSGHGQDKWGSFVDVKVNAAEVLVKELRRVRTHLPRLMPSQARRFEPTIDKGSITDNGANKLRKFEPTVMVLIGSVTDPYQPLEAKYQITRKCLKVVAKSNCPASFSILTKSHLVTRDIDIIKKIPNFSVGLTITTTDDKVSRLLEGSAPSASLRLKALDKLNKAGISTYVCINPLLPHFATSESNLRSLFDAIRKTGNREIWLEHINLGGDRLRRIQEVLKKEAPDVIQYFEEAKTEKYKTDLNRLLFRILADYDFEIGGGGIIDHRRKTIISNDSWSSLSTKEGWQIETV